MSDFADSLVLRPAERRTVVTLLGRYLPNIEVWAYGSRTNGNAVDASDLDLVALSDAEQEPLLDAIREAFEESDLGFRVDIMGWGALPETFRREIERNHVVLAGRRGKATGGAREYRLLGEFIPLSYGAGLRVGERVDGGGVSVFGSNGRIGWHDRTITDGPTVIVGRKGTVGAVTYSHDACWPIDTAFWYSEADAELCRFKYYLLRTLRLEEMNMDSAVPGLSRSFVHALKVPVPNAAEQRRIAKVLGALDDKIESSRRMSETLDQMVRAMFDDWFVKFAPTRAKMEGRRPHLPVELWSLFSERLVESDGGWEPENWPVVRIGDAFRLTMGQSPPGRSYNTEREGLPFLQGRSDFGARYAEPRRHCSAPLRTAAPGDTLVSVRAPIGAMNIARTRCCIGRGVAALRHASGSAAYTYYAVEQLRSILESFESTGTVFGAITKEQFESLRVLEPPSAIVRAFDRRVSPEFERIRGQREEADALASLRDRLAPELLSGELQARR